LGSTGLVAAGCEAQGLHFSHAQAGLIGHALVA
jgi:hypothetical protein